MTSTIPRQRTSLRVERGAEVAPGVFAYSIPSLRIAGKSRQPLLDACRQINSILGPTKSRVALFREGYSEPDIACSVEWGAGRTVFDPSKGRIRFAEFHPFDGRQ
jgi:hypothetical protein